MKFLKINIVNDKLSAKVISAVNAEVFKDSISLKTNWQPSGSEKVYFAKGCTVPRFKVRNKFQVTIKPENSTSIFIPANFNKFVEEIPSMDYVEVDQEFLDIVLDEFYGKQHSVTYLMQSLSNICDQVIVDVKDAHNLWHARIQSGKSVYKSVDDYYSCTVDLDEHQYLGNPKKTLVEDKTFDQIINSYSHNNIYHETEIQKVINEDNIIIDNNKYKDIRMMFNSNDEESHKLAMELMANSNHEKSFVYLAMLLTEFTLQIGQLKEATHVNFKALLQYFELDYNAIRPVRRGGRRRGKVYTKACISLEHLTYLMKKYKKFTRKNVQVLTQYFTEDEFSCDTVHYTTGAVLRPEYIAELDDLEDDLI